MSLDDLVNAIVSRKKDVHELALFVAFDGPGSAGKSTVLTALEYKLVESDLKPLHIKRDWFFFKEPKRHFRRELLEDLLRDLTGQRETASHLGIAAMTTIRDDSNHVHPQSFTVDHDTVVMLDGLREITGLAEDLRFDLHIVIVAAESVREVRERDRGRTPNKWTIGFHNRVDYIVWNNWTKDNPIKPVVLAGPWPTVERADAQIRCGILPHEKPRST